MVSAPKDVKNLIWNEAFKSFVEHNDHALIKYFLGHYLKINDIEKIEICLNIIISTGNDLNDFLLEHYPTFFNDINNCKKITTEEKIKQIELLFDYGLNPNFEQPIGWHIINLCKNKKIFDLLLKKGADINYVRRDKTEKTDKGYKWGEWNYLMLAIFNGYTEVEWICKSGKDVNIDFVGADDCQGMITGVPYGPVTVWDFLEHESNDKNRKTVIKYLNKREKYRIRNLLNIGIITVFPKLIKFKIVKYYKHSKSTLSDKQINKYLLKSKKAK
tara:strand:- start:3257 stop:4075 length:819 start_codon:yes stop_codon:yes gene_type:complete